MGPEFRVNSYTTRNQRSPRIATDSGGNFVVVWQSLYQDGSFYGVFSQRYGSAGAPFGTEFRVNTYTTDSQLFPSLAIGSGGSFVVVWGSYTQDGSGLGVFGQRYGSAGAPLGTEFRVNTYTTNNQWRPSVASDSGGNFVVVWESYKQDGSNYGVFGQRYDSAGAPLGAEFLVNTYTTSTQVRPSVASDSGGNFVVVWQSFSQDDPSYGVFGQRYSSAGAPLGTEFRVNTYTTGLQFLTSVASDPNGNLVVVWHSDGSLGISGQRYGSAGAPLGGEFRVNTYTTGSGSFSPPSVASDSGGAFVVVWQSLDQDGSAYGVFGQRYDSAGTPLGMEFRVNTYTTSDQRYPAVANDSGGHFVVAWQSYAQDGSYNGVFGQRFCSGLPTVTPPPALTTTQTLCQ